MTDVADAHVTLDGTTIADGSVGSFTRYVVTNVNVAGPSWVRDVGVTELTVGGGGVTLNVCIVALVRS